MKKTIIFTVCFFLYTLHLTLSTAFCMGRKPLPKTTTVEEKIARWFGVQEEEVLDLINKGFSKIDAVKILILDKATEKATSEIVKINKEGAELNEIAKDYEIDVEEMNEEARKILKKVDSEIENLPAETEEKGQTEKIIEKGFREDKLSPQSLPTGDSWEKYNKSLKKKTTR